MTPPGRREQLAANLALVRARLADAATAAGRRPDELTLIAVTKTFPADDVRLLAELGVTDVGENRAQEAAGKHAAVDAALRWHFVGAVQRNKAGTVAAFADCVHSVDRAEVAAALDRHAGARGRPLDVLVQVSLDPPGAQDSGRAGVAPAALPALAAAVAGCPALRLRGVMAVAPLGADPDPAFARLAELAAAVRAEHPGATWMSAGMSGDLETAVRHGATHVRIGTALLGRREPPVG